MENTQKLAKQKNEKYYFTGKPCKNGHVSKRNTHNGTCYECVQKASNVCYHKTRTSPEKRKQQILTRIKQRALREGIEFDLTVDNINWPTHCPIFGYELSYYETDKDRSVSIDKNDPQKGYTKDNVVVMSLRANRAKWNLTTTEVKKLYEYFLSRP